MKQTFMENRVSRKISELAKKYAAEGYTVFADLHTYSEPHKIRGFTPDLVVKKGDEIIIIEVKTSESFERNKDAIAQLAQYAEEVPGVRFDLVITNPKPPSSVHHKVETLQAELGTIREGLLVDIKESIKQDWFDLAVLLAVRMLEGLLARLALRENIYVPRAEWTLHGLSRRLAGDKVISQSVLNFASKLNSQRNAIIHGGDRRPLVSKEEALDMYDKLDTLVKRWGETVRAVQEIQCPVCEKSFNSFLNLARHMVLKDRPEGEHIQWLEQFLNKPFVEFGWKSDRRVGIALRNYWVKNKEWPDLQF